MDILSDILGEWEKNAAVTSDDYTGEDGLIYCAKCHTPKQQVLEEKVWKSFTKITPDFPRITYRACDCIAEEERRQDEAKHIAKIEQAREACFPGEEELRTYRFSNDRGIGDREAMQKARTYADGFSYALENNIGLLIWGDVGRGKSHLAACIANSVIEQGYSCLMTNFMNISDGAFDADKHKTEYFDSFSWYDLLIIDDFGAERQSGYVDEIIIKVIERRCNSGKPIIVTTNLEPKKMLNPKNRIEDKRIFSRIFKMTRQIPVKGEDLRTVLNAEIAEKSMKFFGF